MNRYTIRVLVVKDEFTDAQPNAEAIYREKAQRQTLHLCARDRRILDIDTITQIQIFEFDGNTYIQYSAEALGYG